jgi:hypothetical protein
VLVDTETVVGDLIFFTDRLSPSELRLRLKPVMAKLRAAADGAHRPGGERRRTGPAAQAGRPARRRILSDEEFQAANARILGSL